MALASASTSAFSLALATNLVISAFYFTLASAHSLALSAALDFAFYLSLAATLVISAHRCLRFIFYLISQTCRENRRPMHTCTHMKTRATFQVLRP